MFGPISASVVAPALVQMGLPELPVHMFIFYFSCISAITPPIALASYAGAAIAEADAGKVSWEALKLGITAFIIPYMFIFGPSLLLQGDVRYILYDFLTAILGVIALVGAVKKMLLVELRWWERILCICATFNLMQTGVFTDILGFPCLIIVAVRQIVVHQKEKPLAMKEVFDNENS